VVVVTPACAGAAFSAISAASEHSTPRASVRPIVSDSCDPFLGDPF
jgi:hypothetical protein